MNILETIVLLSVLVLFHEMGHFLAARALGIPISHFAVGLGPKLWSRRWQGTTFSLRALPLGGFVEPEVESFEALRAIPLWRRLAFYAAGPFANLLLALPLFGLLNTLRLGVSWHGLFVSPFIHLFVASRQLVVALAGLVGDPSQLSGLVGIAVGGGEMIASGRGIELAILLTVSLGVMNLLPLPILDGGQILFACLEQAFPGLASLRPAATVLGGLFLIAVMAYANVRDVVQLLG